MKKLIKIDRNGSKHFEGTVECPRCNGSGLYIYAVVNGVPVPTIVDGGVCHKCNGSGKVLGKWIERTPEYQVKLDAKKAARLKDKMEAAEAKRKAEFLSKHLQSLANNGFNSEGQTFLFLGDTFSRKDEIKEAGGKYSTSIGWHIDHKIDGFHFLEVHVHEVACTDDWGVIHITAERSEWDFKKKKALKELEGDAGFFGTVGQKVQIELELVRTSSYEVRFAKGMWGTTTNYIHIMKDSDGHIFIWKTSKVLEKVEGERFVIKGTIKEHGEYNHDKQTVLTRCKVM